MARYGQPVFEPPPRELLSEPQREAFDRARADAARARRCHEAGALPRSEPSCCGAAGALPPTWRDAFLRPSTAGSPASATTTDDDVTPPSLQCWPSQPSPRRSVHVRRGTTPGGHMARPMTMKNDAFVDATACSTRRQRHAGVPLMMRDGMTDVQRAIADAAARLGFDDSAAATGRGRSTATAAPRGRRTRTPSA